MPVAQAYCNYFRIGFYRAVRLFVDSVALTIWICVREKGREEKTERKKNLQLQPTISGHHDKLENARARALHFRGQGGVVNV